MENILVSACLLGTKCRYDGRDNLINNFDELNKHAIFVKICPEIAGGLLVPRLPCEIMGDKVMTKCGIDCTKEFHKGANLTLDLVKHHNIRYALLRSRSPSCGFNEVYDGTFTHTPIKGRGICAQKLHDAGVIIFDENNIHELIKLLKVTQ